jgi:hypothetical protein
MFWLCIAGLAGGIASSGLIATLMQLGFSMAGIGLMVSFYIFNTALFISTAPSLGVLYALCVFIFLGMYVIP